MPSVSAPQSISESLRQLIGYLNFSSGASDHATLAAWDKVYWAAAGNNPLSGLPAFAVLREWIVDTMDDLEGESAAFKDLAQARQIVRLVWSDLIPSYLDFHGELLFHQTHEQVFFNGFFLGRCVEAALRSAADIGPIPAGDAPGREHATRQIIDRAIDYLNDFVGYRPVAQLENRDCKPYPHEYIRPVPLYIRGVGVSDGPYQEIVQRMLDIIGQTGDAILTAASFDLQRVSELCYDPRAYDFDHPVNRRPNYHFGQWDPDAIDADGHYERFVLQQVTLDAILSRTTQNGDLSRDELLTEAAAVLAGTILMASGITGWGPSAYTSDVTLQNLMAPIAKYRDAFYRDLMDRMTGEHGKRLKQEEKIRQQPFGAARQNLNAALARHRAVQLQHVHLARLYARMGYPDAARKQSAVVNVTSARIMTRIDCELTLGLRQLRGGDIASAAAVPEKVFAALQRGIQCGAIVDPWNILGFAGNFSRFFGPESGMHDHRVDDLVYLVESLLSYMAAVWSEAAASDDQALHERIDRQYRNYADWWRQYAAHTVQELEAADPDELYQSAQLVARALRLWHRGGAAAGDVAFWAPHADLFDSPRAYSLVIIAMLERDDYVASMALLIHWLTNADRIGLRSGDSSLPDLALQ
ncbi:MAG: hypothetical protein AAFP69_16070, partial [Planctomycetota bacterium]